MTYAKEYSTSELMAANVARQIHDHDVVFIGVGVPMIAGVVAVSTHAPNATMVFEGGGIGARPRRVPLAISDSPTTENGLGAAQMWRVLCDVQRGFITLGVIGGAEIDRFGNLNTTVVFGPNGTYARPKVRLPGSGGANDVASSIRRNLIMMRLEKGKFVNRVQFITSPGYLSGPGDRERAGLIGGGPEMVITEKCIFGFDEKTKEMYLQKLYPGVKVDDIKKLVDWDLQVSPDLDEVEPPTEEQVRIMRTFDSMGLILGGRSVSQWKTFDEYYDRMKKAYESVVLDLES
ncbi:MAG: 3-oxoadipate CoA-transferase subunit B [Syntrophaceae bacterium PtaU1.Bin231]|nr:MAG: 3-oxoadipate CoA-transferase subunit B [Syntrophaceae bacterium PtaU1.Bin231]